MWWQMVSCRSGDAGTSGNQMARVEFQQFCMLKQMVRQSTTQAPHMFYPIVPNKLHLHKDEVSNSVS